MVSPLQYFHNIIILLGSAAIKHYHLLYLSLVGIFGHQYIIIQVCYTTYRGIVRVRCCFWVVALRSPKALFGKMLPKSTI